MALLLTDDEDKALTRLYMKRSMLEGELCCVEHEIKILERRQRDAFDRMMTEAKERALNERSHLRLVLP